MHSQLYLCELQKELYIDKLTLIKTMFLERIQPIFANAKDEATTFQDKLWNDFMNRPCSEDDYSDPANYAETVEGTAIDYYLMLCLMHYQQIAMHISLLCQVWEQQLFSFIVKECRYPFSKTKDSFQFVKDVFAQHHQPIENLTSWEKIQELRWLVNVIKHAEGFSEQSLRKRRPDFFTRKLLGMTFDPLSIHHTSLCERTLNISEKDFMEYYDALVEFWEQVSKQTHTKQ